MRDAIFKEYGLSAKCFLDKFNQVKKATSDTYVLYSSKLEGLLNQYLDARKIGGKYEDLVSLFMSDRIKSELPEHCLKHVLSVDSAMEAPGWLRPQRLSEIIDEYVSNVGVNTHVTSSFLGQQHRLRPQPQYVDKTPNGLNAGGRRCNLCGSAFHLMAKCDKRERQPLRPPHSNP